jgi:hypothetical protein
MMLAHHEALGQRHAVEQLHHEVGSCRVAAEVADVDDVAVADARRDLRLALEALDGTLRRRALGVEQLDRDLLLEGLVLGAPHGAHAADAERVDQAILACDDLSSSRHVDGPLRALRVTARDGHERAQASGPRVP